MEPKPEINKKNVLAFIEGNLKMLGDRINLLPDFKKEQVIWRYNICKDDCVVNKKCKYCGCSVPGKLYVDKSCNRGERFPDMMTSEEWKNYKEQNGISIDINQKLD
jgi:hypothetical protein